MVFDLGFRLWLCRLAFLLGAGFLACGLALAQVSTPPAPGMEQPSADASSGRLVELTAKPVIRLRGQSTWDDGFSELRKAIESLERDAKRLGLAPVGPPRAHFVDSDDLGFTFEAFMPLAADAASDLAFSPGIAPGQSPAGRAVLFTHEGPYDEIDAAYEAITAFLDEKGLNATGQFVEEYVVIPERSDDPAMKLQIFVFLR